jgi:hypothetical protein
MQGKGCRALAGAFVVVLNTLSMGAAAAAPAVSCGGAAMMGGAELMCSHVDPDAPPQLCTFSWTLMTTDKKSEIVQGSFLIAPGATNVAVYQGGGFDSQVAAPIVLCQGKKSE